MPDARFRQRQKKTTRQKDHEKGGRFRLGDRIRSIGYGIGSLYGVLSSQHDSRIHALATVLVCFFAVHFSLAKTEWCLIVIGILTLWMAQVFNTALGSLADVVSLDFHHVLGKSQRCGCRCSNSCRGVGGHWDSGTRATYAPGRVQPSRLLSLSP